MAWGSCSSLVLSLHSHSLSSLKTQGGHHGPACHNPSSVGFSDRLVRTASLPPWLWPHRHWAGGVGISAHRIGHAVCADCAVTDIAEHCHTVTGRPPRGTLGLASGND